MVLFFRQSFDNRSKRAKLPTREFVFHFTHHSHDRFIFRHTIKYVEESSPVTQIRTEKTKQTIEMSLWGVLLYLLYVFPFSIIMFFRTPFSRTYLFRQLPLFFGLLITLSSATNPIICFTFSLWQAMGWGTFIKREIKTAPQTEASSGKPE